MTIPETRQKILESDKFVISELIKMQTLFKLKKEIRYDQKRHLEADTESVAEHVYGMQCLIDYFLPLENEKGDWDSERIRLMVQYHDIDEIETGDVVGYRKSPTNREKERNASEIVIGKLPKMIQDHIRDLLDEYESRHTPEAKFVKALDSIETVFHVYNEEGKVTLTDLGTTKTQHDSIKTPHVKDFPYVRRFLEVMSEQFKTEGFYHPESQ